MQLQYAPVDIKYWRWLGTVETTQFEFNGIKTLSANVWFGVTARLFSIWTVWEQHCDVGLAKKRWIHSSTGDTIKWKKVGSAIARCKYLYSLCSIDYIIWKEKERFYFKCWWWVTFWVLSMFPSLMIATVEKCTYGFVTLLLVCHRLFQLSHYKYKRLYVIGYFRPHTTAGWRFRNTRIVGSISQGLISGSIQLPGQETLTSEDVCKYANDIISGSPP